MSRSFWVFRLAELYDMVLQHVFVLYDFLYDYKKSFVSTGVSLHFLIRRHFIIGFSFSASFLGHWLVFNIILSSVFIFLDHWLVYHIILSSILVFLVNFI